MNEKRMMTVALVVFAAACGAPQKESPVEPADTDTPAQATQAPEAPASKPAAPAPAEQTPAAAKETTRDTGTDTGARPVDATGITPRPTELRAAPLLDAEQIAELDAGTTVQVISTQSAWYQVRSGELQGWLRMTHVRLAGEADASTEAPLETGRSGAGNVATTAGIRGLLSDPAADTPDAGPGELAGVWQLNVGFPGGPQQPTLTIVRQEDTYTATFEDKRGITEIPSVEGDGFEVKVRTPAGSVSFQYAGKVQGDVMSGDIKAPVGRISFTGKRQRL